jgi:hypothetical protein
MEITFSIHILMKIIGILVINDTLKYVFCLVSKFYSDRMKREFPSISRCDSI